VTEVPEADGKSLRAAQDKALADGHLRAVLDTPMGDNDAEAETVGHYLLKLLAKVWRDGEDLTKRPFGNSGWQFEVYKALINNGMIDGTVDEDGYVDELDIRAAEEQMVEAIGKLQWAKP
jgi:hypothetical protein